MPSAKCMPSFRRLVTVCVFAYLTGFSALAYATDPITTIVGDGSSRCVDVPFQNFARGTDLHLWDCHRDQSQARAQRWTLRVNGEVRIAGKCLDVEGASRANGAKAQIWDCVNVAQQKFSYSTRTRRIRSLHSGKCLTAQGGGSWNGTLLEFQECNNHSSQRWSFPDSQSGFPPTTSIRSTQLVGIGGLCLDLPYANTSNGTDLWMWGCHSNQSQATAQTWAIDNNGHIKVMGKCLDVEGASASNGADAQIWQCYDVPQQKFDVTVAGEIRSRLSGKCLTVKNSGTSYRTRLEFYPCDGRSSQRWAHPGLASSGVISCNGSYVNSVTYDSTDKGLVIRYWPTNRARAEGVGGWSELEHCKPAAFWNWSFVRTTGVINVHSQAECHGFWGITPYPGGYKWDLESYSNLPWDKYGAWWDTRCQGYRLR